MAAAGIVSDVFLAAVALLIWSAAEPGLVRAVCFNVALMTGLGTLLFNANPLMRFDGYYILVEILDTPNLATRAQRCLAWLTQRVALGPSAPSSPAQTPRAALGLLGYGVCAYLYRVVLIGSIVVLIAEQSLTVGAVLGLWAGWSLVVAPLVRQLRALQAEARRLRRVRRAVTAVALLPGVLVAIWLQPLSLSTAASGVVWLPERAQVRAETAGVLQRLVGQPSQRVEAGALLFELEDATLDAEIAVLRARVDEIGARYQAARYEDRVEAAKYREALTAAQAELDRAVERRDGLQVRTAQAGRFILARPGDPVGRYVRQGEALGYVVLRRRGRRRAHHRGRRGRQSRARSDDHTVFPGWDPGAVRRGARHDRRQLGRHDRHRHDGCGQWRRRDRTAGDECHHR